MIDRIRRIFELELPVRRVFDEPRIEGLAGELQKAQALGLKARVPIVQPLATSAVTGASREARLSQLSELSADEAQNLIKRALNSKALGLGLPPRIEPGSGDAIPITQEAQKLALFGLSGSDDQSTASEQ
jgi:hypothetical protein